MTQDNLVIEYCYFFVCIKHFNVPVIKSLIYKGKNLDKAADAEGKDKFFFEDADDGCFTPPSKRTKKPITMDEEMLSSLMDLEEFINYLEDIRDGKRMI